MQIPMLAASSLLAHVATSQPDGRFGAAQGSLLHVPLASDGGEGALAAPFHSRVELGKDPAKEEKGDPAKKKAEKEACPGKDHFRLTVEVLTDSYGYETRWKVTDNCAGHRVVYKRGYDSASKYTSGNTLFEDDQCLPPSEYTFTIEDTYGDGICCDVGEGRYTLYEDGVEVAAGGDFAESESRAFGGLCPSASPSGSPSRAPSALPSLSPTYSPTVSEAPTSLPSPSPSGAPTGEPSAAPTGGPSVAPTGSPTPRPTPKPTSPPTVTPKCNTVAVEVKPDSYPGETSWDIKDACDGNKVVMKRDSYSTPNVVAKDEKCLLPSRYTFTINDSFGDGLCCAYGEGTYKVTVNGAQVAGGKGDIGRVRTHSFGKCASAIE